MRYLMQRGFMSALLGAKRGLEVDCFNRKAWSRIHAEQ